ncbi:MAG: hypothetical protein K5773_04170 [Pseudobutyrivibrio sp.]|nr:hypothetical protein [Pseudobutyrivibrio sp.]
MTFNKRFSFKYLSTLLSLILCLCLFVAAGKPVQASTLIPTYRSFLNNSQQQVYDQAYSYAMIRSQEKFKMASGQSEADLEMTMNALYNDHPELYWLDTSYNYAMTHSGTCLYLQLCYNSCPGDVNNYDQEYLEIISQIMTQVNACTSDLDKERVIYDSICNLTNYNPASPFNQSAFSAIATGSSVCAGYSRAFQLLCTMAGIPCIYITGYSKGQPHAWNIVQIDGRYYNVDVTWEDCVRESMAGSYYFFNKTDAEFAKDHVRSAYSAVMVPCD